MDEGEYWLAEDLEVRCWIGDHAKLSLFIGLPLLIFWVIGLPTLGFMYFFKHREKLDRREMQEKYRIVYNGLKKKYFFWEFVNILRKIFLVSVNVFL